MAAGRKALVVATYDYKDAGLRRLAAPEHDAESLATVLEDPQIAGFDVTTLVNQPHHVVGEAIADFYSGARREDLTLLYFTGHGLKDDEGRFYLAMTNTRRSALMFTAISGAQLNDAMDASPSRRKVLVLDCCYSGAFPAGRTAKADEGVQTLERFQGKGRAVLTASDATQYAFEGDDLTGVGTSSVFTRHLVEAIRTGAADLDEDGDIALDELYSYVRERVVAEMPQQRPKKQEDVDGRILIARNVHWTLPAHLRHAIESPISVQRLSAVEGLAHLHRVGNDIVRASVTEQLVALATDDSRSVSAAATALLERVGADRPDALPRPRGPVDAVPVDVRPAATAPAAAPPGRAPAGLPRIEAPIDVRHPDAEPPETVRAPVTDRVAWDRPTADRMATESPATARRDATAPIDELPLPVVLGLLLAGGALLLAARMVVFDPVYDQRASDVGFRTTPWIVWVGIPLAVAGQLLLVRRNLAWGTGLAVGLMTGAMLTQLDQVLVSTGFILDADVGHGAGTGWWLALAGTVVLATAVALLLRRSPFRARPGAQRNGRAAFAAAVLFAALVAWVSANSDFYIWFSANVHAFLMFAVAYPVAVLALNPAQRVVGLVAVTVLGGWLATSVLEQIVLDSYGGDPWRGVTVAVSALASVAACYLAQARRTAAPPEDATRTAGASSADTAPRLPLITSLVLVGGLLLVPSRFLIIETESQLTSSEIGVPWLSWLVGAGLPLMVALQLLVQRSDARWAIALGGGLVGGAAIGQLDLVLATGSYWIHPDMSGQAGPAWWATVLVTAVLITCAVLVLRRPELRGRPRLGRDWRAVVAVLVVLAALAAWLSAFRWASPWLTYNEPALLLAAACLPVAALELQPTQRLFGLAAVTVLAPWVASSHVQDLIEDSYTLDAKEAVVGLLAAAASLAACYLTQARPARSREAAAGATARR